MDSFPPAKSRSRATSLGNVWGLEFGVSGVDDSDVLGPMKYSYEN